MSISIESLQEALSIKEKIHTLEIRLSKLLALDKQVKPLTAPAPIKKRRRKMSAAARARISAAQKARWAAKKN